MSTSAHLIATTSGTLFLLRSFGASIALEILRCLYSSEPNVYTADNAIFSSTLPKSIGPNIAIVVLPLGPLESSLGAFIGAFTTDDTADLFKIPGVTPETAGADGLALQKTYENSFNGCGFALPIWRV